MLALFEVAGFGDRSVRRPLSVAGSKLWNNTGG